MLARIASAALLLFVAVSCQAGGIPVGTLTSSGFVRVSGIAAPSGATVFAGDTIETDAAGAVVTLTGGDSFLLGANAGVRLSRADNGPAIEFLKGLVRVQVRSRDLRLAASNWALQAKPDVNSGRATADVVRQADGTVSLNVTEGEVVAKDSAGKPVAVAAAGRPTLLPASAVPPKDSSAPSGAPQGTPQSGKSGNSVSKAVVIGAYAVGAAAVGVGVGVLASREDTSGLRNQVQQLQTQLQQLVSQNQALQTQVSALITTLNSLIANVQNQQGLLNQLLSTISDLQTAQSQLAQTQAQLSTLLAKVAAGQPLTPAEQQQVATLSAQLTQLSSRIGTLTTTALNLINQIKNLPPPPSPIK